METSGVLWNQAHAHPPEEVLERYAMSCASERECERIEEHILLCASCREQLNEADAWVALMKAAAAPVPSAAPNYEAVLPFWQRWTRSASAAFSAIPAPAFAGAFAVVCLMLWVAPVGNRSGGGDGLPQQSVSLSALRGNELQVPVQRGTPLELQFDDAEAGAATVAIVDSGGKQVWSGPLGGVDRRRRVSVPALAKGSYWVRLFSAPSGEQIKEYGLAVE